MAHVLLEHYQADANTIEPTTGFLNAAALILGDNIVLGDTLNAADQRRAVRLAARTRAGASCGCGRCALVPRRTGTCSGPSGSRTPSRSTTRELRPPTRSRPPDEGRGDQR